VEPGGELGLMEFGDEYNDKEKYNQHNIFVN